MNAWDKTDSIFGQSGPGMSRKAFLSYAEASVWISFGEARPQFIYWNDAWNAQMNAFEVEN